MSTATATRTTREQTQAFERRALELAREHHLLGSAHYVGPRPDCETIEVFTVRSDSAGTIYHHRHIVEHDLITDAIHCDCKAGKRGHACGHAGSVADALNARAAMIASAVLLAAEDDAR